MRIWLVIGVFIGIGVTAQAVSAQPAPGGGLTVREARASTLTGVLLVRGFVFVDRRGHVKLCERLVGKPPTCGGAALAIVRVSRPQLGALRGAVGVSWSARPRALFGRLRDGRLVFAPNVR
jgi:hypothetical protein